jgi:hypothetical protein
MTTRTKHFVLDWWVVQKRVLYLIVAALILLVVAAAAAAYVWKFGNPLKNVGTEVKPPAGARFISFEGDVRVIRGATRETISASSDTTLYPGDTVQTQASGRARISMADGSTLVVRPNSTIVVRDNTTSNDGRKPNVKVAVESGQMYVRTEQQPEGTVHIVETPKTKNKVGDQTGVSFGVNPDNTEEIRVNEGVVETTNPAGEKTSLHGGEYASVNVSGTVSRQKLLEVPTPSEPRDLQKVLVGPGGSASITLKWIRPSAGVPSYYRVEVATSPFFVADGKVIERDQLVATEFSATDLRPGVYFWRVRGTAQSGQTSDWSEVKKFVVATRGTGSEVPVTNLTAEYLGGSIYLVRGRAEPGTTITIADREAIVPTDGNFQVQVTGHNGRDVIVYAQDQLGNRSQYKLSLNSNRR